MDSAYIVVPALILLITILTTYFSIRRMVSLSAKTYGRGRKATERIMLSVLVLLAIAVAGNSTYNAIALLVFLATHLPLGKLYSVHGHKMQLYCVGSGEPTIVLEPGLGPATDVLSWSSLQPKLARTTRVCSYDRAGLGWSEPRTGPSDADQIAADLHDLLALAQVSGPIVLMGTSYGGIYIRDYTAHFRADVAGLVFVDSSTPFQEERFQALAGQSHQPRPAGRLAMLSAVCFLGAPRLLGWCGKPVPGLESRLGEALGEDACVPHYEGLKELLSMAQSSTEAARAGPLGDLPILIFSHDPANVLAMQNPLPPWAAREKLWNEMQEELKGLSTRSRRIIAKGSGHGICVDREDLILREVPLFLDQIRGAAPEPADYGSTTVE